MAKAYHTSTDQLLGVTKKALLEPNEDFINEREAEKKELEKALKNLLKNYGIIDKEL